MKRIFTIFTIFSTLVCLSSCGPVDDSSQAVAEELGLPQKEYIIGYRGEDIEVSIWSNLAGTITPIDDDSSWARLSQYTFDGDTQINLTTEMNDGFPRMAQFELVTNGLERKDTLTVKQKGLYEPRLVIPNNSAMIMNGQGNTKIAISTNIDFEDMETKVTYSGTETDWISSFTIEDGKYIVITSVDNPSEDKLRNVVINFRYVDGWKVEYAQDLYLTQANSKNEFGIEATFEDVRDLALDAAPGEAMKISDYLYIYGYVVSNPEFLNSSENPQVTNTQVDYTGAKRTFMFESLDGKYGFKIESADLTDNVLKQYAKGQILLAGMTITRHTDPERYELSGFTSANLLSSEQCTAADIPTKKLHMSELTDNDIYTYVTLQDVEFVVKKGSLTPVNEGYTNAYNAHRSTKFPLMLRDANDASVLYTLTNTSCKYRRDGTKLPYGVGEFSGVIVHEKHRPFSDFDAPTDDDSQYGNIGRYQIRHQQRSDIAMPDERDYSNVLFEYNYWLKGSNRHLIATYGESQMIHSYPNYTGAEGMSFYNSGSWPYLGPIGARADNEFGTGLQKGNKNGCGLYDTEGTELLPPGCEYDQYINSDGKGQVTGSARPTGAWTNNYWWDSKNDVGYAYIVEFSTKELTSATHLTLQVSQLNTSQGQNAAGVNDGTNIGTPRYWKIQYYVGVAAPSDDSEDWIDLPDSEYSVPDVVIWSNTLFSQSNGFKTSNFELPLELLGQERVFIAIRPSRNVASSGVDYQDSVIRTDAKGSSAMEYCAIRYCK